MSDLGGDGGVRSLGALVDIHVFVNIDDLSRCACEAASYVEQLVVGWLAVSERHCFDIRMCIVAARESHSCPVRLLGSS
jgi:hypothetical protein